jgi:hypothetical protein
MPWEKLTAKGTKNAKVKTILQTLIPKLEFGNESGDGRVKPNSLRVLRGCPLWFICDIRAGCHFPSNFIIASG